MQNDGASTDKIRDLFASHYDIIDIADLDVEKREAVDIEKRIANFRQRYSNYHVDVEQLIAESNQVFVWFKVVLSNKKILLNSFVIFTLKNGKITKAVEMIKMSSLKTR